MKFQITQLGHDLRRLVTRGWDHHVLLLDADFVHYRRCERAGASLTIGLPLLEVGGLRGLLEEGVLTLLQDLLGVRHFKF